MKKKMLPIAVEETKQNLVTVINESGIPACVMELIIKDIYHECRQAAVNEYRNCNKMEREVEISGDKA